MLKRPQHSKRRIAAELGSLADELAARLIDCALEDLADWTGSVCLAPATSADLGWAETLLSHTRGRRYLMAQQQGNLGQRIMQVDQLLRAQGETNIIMLGTDCPTISSAYLDQAKNALASHAVVLGPARDGGVVLMGSARPWPDLTDLPWSTASLSEALSGLCASNGNRIAWLEQHSDVDSAADLAELGNKLGHDPRPGRRALTAWLTAHQDAWSPAS